MNKKEILKQALQENEMVYEEWGGPADIEYVASLAKELNYDEETIDFIIHNYSIDIPKSFLSKSTFLMSDDEEKAVLIKYLKHINEKGE